MRSKSRLLLALVVITGSVLADERSSEQPEGEIGYYFLPTYTTAPLRFSSAGKILKAEDILEEKCPGAKFLTVSPTNGPGSRISAYFVISFRMPLPGCPQSW